MRTLLSRHVVDPHPFCHKPSHPSLTIYTPPVPSLHSHPPLTPIPPPLPLSLSPPPPLPPPHPPTPLGTVRDNLRTRVYKSILAFAEDVRLTFRNALTYNPPGHQIHDMAGAYLQQQQQQQPIHVLCTFSLPLGDTVSIASPLRSDLNTPLHTFLNPLTPTGPSSNPLSFSPIFQPLPSTLRIDDERVRDESRRATHRIRGCGAPGGKRGQIP